MKTRFLLSILSTALMFTVVASAPPIPRLYVPSSGTQLYAPPSDWQECRSGYVNKWDQKKKKYVKVKSSCAYKVTCKYVSSGNNNNNSTSSGTLKTKVCR
jgi:hypothetical protein